MSMRIKEEIEKVSFLALSSCMYCLLGSLGGQNCQAYLKIWSKLVTCCVVETRSVIDQN